MREKRNESDTHVFIRENSFSLENKIYKCGKKDDVRDNKIENANVKCECECERARKESVEI